MKKSLLFIVAVLSITTIASAQDISKNAIGLRFGSANGLGTEVSYQRALGDNNRLEVDLGLESDDDFTAFKLTGIYQWVWNIDGSFNWYAGAGGGVGSVDYDNDFDGLDGRDTSETFLYAAGQVGIEYSFDFPLQISIDTRPELGFGDLRNDLSLGLSLGLRYQF
ncbi:MAG: hypothetical protein ACSHWW_07265 [Nonlabens sp.]|uniref:hypothetical protein n=1 Tax=Nonlabens sp. TaxID=1888209 RepID=UPI003EF8C750